MESVSAVSRLNEYAQKKKFLLQYEDLGFGGPNRDKQFTQRVVLNGKVYPEGVGKTKKEAKQDAAKNALRDLSECTHQTAVENYNPAQQKQEPNQNYSDICNKTRSLSVNSQDNSSEHNFIGLVDHYCQKKNHHYTFIEDKRLGPAHEPQYSYKLTINGKKYPVAEGRTKKEAKQNAAKLAWFDLQEQSDWDSKVSIRSTVSEGGALPVLSTPSTPLGSYEASSQRTSTSTSPSITFEDSTNPSQAQMPLESESDTPTRLSNSLESISSSQSMSTSTSGSGIFTDSSNSSKDQHPVKDKIIGNTENQTSTLSRFTSEFDITECLGKGAYGCVYAARDKRLKQGYAVKIVRSNEKALREVGTLSKLLHCNIVRYYTFWMEDSIYQDHTTAGNSAGSFSSSQSIEDPSAKYLYIQMELCKTKTLKKWINEKNAQSLQDSKRRQESVAIAQQIVSGVEYIHRKGHIHRDLKPENILFGVDGEVKIGDFGMVTKDDDDDDDTALMERTGLRGTSTYMAPEQITGKTYDRKVDIFALGLIYFELLWKLSTGHERGVVWNDARSQKLPEEFSLTFAKENEIIKLMLREKPEDRPEASKLTAELKKWAQTQNMDQERATV
ncbi:interferon-induced, double-stranded RNA-activated protein kinase-like [Trematomus bernacchii]|uniref:interferon-induced, double-stranded RNA-activated protein kinase-like n=1 Tax=Trematomus bernacchii TaxID=40690 RepID=UPI00146D5333|nr:interferon-induced, double-stranded RNA-activated protein kinase-like [Trematomus bernacchii]